MQQNVFQSVFFNILMNKTLFVRLHNLSTICVSRNLKVLFSYAMSISLTQAFKWHLTQHFGSMFS